MYFILQKQLSLYVTCRILVKYGPDLTSNNKYFIFVIFSHIDNIDNIVIVFSPFLECIDRCRLITQMIVISLPLFNSFVAAVYSVA